MKIKRAILVFFLGLMLVPLTCMSGFAELQVGANYALDGTVTLGGGWLSPSPRGMNRGYLEKYVPFPQGFLAYTDLTLKSMDDLEYYKFFMSQPGLRDQNYLVQIGRLRLFHTEFEFDEMQNIYCSFNPFNNHIGIHIYRLRASGWVNVTPDITLFAEDTFLRRTGSQPASINAGPGDPYNFRAKTLRPVNYSQNDLRVGAEYDRAQGQFRVAYHHSTFEDGGAIFLAQRPGTAAPFYTQMSLPPSNMANYITAEGAINMPQYKTRLTGSISYGWLGQNESVYRNVNFLNGQRGVDQGNANLGATTFAAYFSGTSRPMDQLTLRYAYRAYNYSNDNSVGNALVRNAFTAAGGGGLNLLPVEHYSYLQQTVNLGADYKVNSKLSVNVGYAWKGFNRTDAQGTTSTNNPSVGARWCPTDWLSLMANYSLSFRQGTNYLDVLQELEAGVPVTYKFYAGTMNRNTFNFIAEVTPVNNVTCSANVSFYNDAYKNNFYGLLSDQGWSAGADVSWRPTDRIALSLGYDFQSIKTRISSVAQTSIFGEIGNVSGDWGYMLWTSDTYNTIAFKGDFKLIPDKLSFMTSANYSWSNSNFHNQVIPNLNESILYTSSSFGYKFNEHWACRVGYIFQYFNMSSAYQTLYLRGIGGNGVQGVQNNQRLNTLNGFYPNATAHIVQGFLQYKF